MDGWVRKRGDAASALPRAGAGISGFKDRYCVLWGTTLYFSPTYAGRYKGPAHHRGSVGSSSSGGGGSRVLSGLFKRSGSRRGAGDSGAASISATGSDSDLAIIPLSDVTRVALSSELGHWAPPAAIHLATRTGITHTLVPHPTKLRDAFAVANDWLLAMRHAQACVEQASRSTAIANADRVRREHLRSEQEKARRERARAGFIRYGPVQERAEGVLNVVWRNRYAVLTADSFSMYSDEEDVYSDKRPVISFGITGVQGVRHPLTTENAMMQNYKNTVVIKTRTGSIMVDAGDEGSAEQWVRDIAKCARTWSHPADPPPPNFFLIPADTPPPPCLRCVQAWK